MHNIVQLFYAFWAILVVASLGIDWFMIDGQQAWNQKNEATRILQRSCEYYQSRACYDDEHNINLNPRFSGGQSLGVR